MLQQGWPWTATLVSASGPGQRVPSPATETHDTPGERDPLCQAAALESSLPAGAAQAEPGRSTANGQSILSLMRARGLQN